MTPQRPVPLVEGGATPIRVFRKIEPPAIKPVLRTPRWVRWSMLALVICSAAVYGWDASGAGYSDYYATAAKSMSTSWKAFFFGAFDPQSTITLDKLSGFLLPQALSVRLFGFSAWSLAIPQVVEGLVTIVAVYFIIRRWIGPIGGLIGATLMAATPLLVSMFSHPMEDGLLTMFSTLALWALQVGIDTGKHRYVLLAGALVGLAFQAKMMQAWIPLPSMALVYLLAAAGGRAHKIRRLAETALVTLVVSFSWMTAIALVPANRRPFIDGTTDNNIFSMVLGYNGINRFVANVVPGALTNDPMAYSASTGRLVGLLPPDLAHNPIKLFLPSYASQIGWLYPLAALGLVLGIFVVRKSSPATTALPSLRIAVVLSGSLLITTGAILTVMNFPHTAYLAAMAFPLAALSAVGIVLAWRDPFVRQSNLRFALPVTVSVQTVWCLVLMSNYPHFAGWLLSIVGASGAVLSLSLFVCARGTNQRRGRWSITAVLALAMLAPVAWSLSTLDTTYAGTANDAYAGPPASALTPVAGNPPIVYGIGLDSNRVTPSTRRSEALIYRYAVDHSGNSRFALATDTWRSAAPIIMSGGTRVLPMGGYTSRVKAPSATYLRQLVAGKRVTFVLLTEPDSKSGISTPNIFEMQAWVRSSCRLVPEAHYNFGRSSGPRGSAGLDKLYDCRP
jgi:4-amino-4-deoxy-L-arabinose transferase-like glycosyltransferase